MSTKPMRVLIVDDEPINRKLLARMLKGSAVEYEEAGSGAEAIALAGAGNYDTVLLDISMPEISGLVVASELRRMLGARAPRLIACTAHGGAADVRRLLDEAFETVLIKPFIRADVLRMLGLPDS